MATTTHDMNELKRRMQGAIQVLKQELGGLRTGRASANLLEPIQVEAYGTHMPLNQVATVSVPEPRLISVQVWDKSMVHAVEKAIHASNLGLSPSTDGQVLRLRIPELNEDRRKDLVKVAHKYAEAAKVAVRHVRRDGLDVLKKLEKDHKISEDEGKRSSEQVQKVTDDVIVEVDKMLRGKRKGNPHRCLRIGGMSMPEAARCVPGYVRSSRCQRHVAIIMDGNGRWAVGPRPAAQRGAPTRCRSAAAHGARRRRPRHRHPDDLLLQLRELVASACRGARVDGMLRRFIRNDLAELNQQWRACAGDRRARRSLADIRSLLEEAEELTLNNDKLTLVVAFNYGARQEIARAAQRLATQVAEGRIPKEAITADAITAHLDAPDLPDPDLIIRTSGEQRLSNFLLWQAAYSELVFVPTYWPDFDRSTLEGAIAEYRRRERRFGGLIAQTGS